MKRAVSLTIAVLMVAAIINCAPALSVSATPETLVENVSPAILCDVGEPVALSGYSVEMPDGSVLDSPTWYYGGSEVTTVTADAAGVTELTAEQGSKSRTVYLVSKNPDDTEYVLYENTFDDEESIADLKKTDASRFSVNDGKLVITTTNTANSRIYMPDFLADFGNYNIETSAAMLSSTDASRWFSICYRAQNMQRTGANLGTPYIHMCVRKSMATAGTSTTGGVECVIANATGGWDYLKSTGYTENMTYGTFYNIKVSAYNGTIQYFINGDSVIYLKGVPTVGTASTYCGGIGLQGNSSVMNFDYIRVTVIEEEPEEPEYGEHIIEVPHIETNLLNSVTNVLWTEPTMFIELFRSAPEIVPATVILDLPDEKYVINENDSLQTFRMSSEAGIIPALRVYNSDSVNNIVAACKKAGFADILIVSDNRELLQLARDSYSVIRTALIADGSEGFTDAQDYREYVKGCDANILLLNGELCSKELVSEIQALHVTVWAYNQTKDLNSVEAAWLISSGANGIVTGDYASVYDTMTEVYGERTLTKTPSIIGHRGNPSQMPENSIEGYITAVKNGATEVETDIHLSKDGYVIVCHDGTLNRTTNYNGSLSISQMTLEEIKSYRLLNNNGTVSDYTVPTFEEMLVALKDYDCNIVVELKAYNTGMLKAVSDLIDKYDYASRINVISFYGDMLTSLLDIRRDISTGYLSGSLSSWSSSAELRENFYNLLSAAQVYDSSINISYGNINKEFYTLLSDRGITLWPWTYSKSVATAFYNAFLWGVDGLTTNDAQLTVDTVRSFDIPMAGSEKRIAYSSQLRIGATVATYGGKRSSAAGESLGITWLTDSLGCTFNAQTGVLTAGTESGTVSFMLNYSAKLPNGAGYVLYSQPVIITVGDYSEIELTDVSKCRLNEEDRLILRAGCGAVGDFVTVNLKNADKIIVLDADGNEVKPSSDLKNGFIAQLSIDGVVHDERRIIVSGDVNANGKIDAADYLMIKRAFLGTHTLDTISGFAADVNINGKLDAADYLMVKRAFLGTYNLVG